MASFCRGLVSVVVLALAVVLVACTAQPLPIVRVAVQLTPEGNPYQVIASGSLFTVRNSESGRNNREIYWNLNTPNSSSATQCATWTSGSEFAQNGLVFRIVPQSGGYNAIVFARNVWGYEYWLFAPKMFHTGADYGAIGWDSPPGIDLSEYLGRSANAVWPLRICASLSADNVLRFAVAKGSDPLPPLDNPGRQGGSWNLDISRYYHVGEGLTGQNGGIFAAHLPSGTSLVFDDITLDGQPAPLPG